MNIGGNKNMIFIEVEKVIGREGSIFFAPYVFYGFRCDISDSIEDIMIAECVAYIIEDFSAERDELRREKVL